MVIIGMCVLSASAEANSITITSPVVANGDFENGDLTGWTASGNVQVQNNVPVAGGSYALVLNSPAGPTGRLSQTFAVTAGQLYQLSYQYAATGQGLNASLLASVTDANGHVVVATQVNPSVSTSSYRTITAIFFATTPTMTLSFQDMSTASGARDGLLDNVQIVPAPLFSHPGDYVGTVVETGSFYGGNITLSRTLAIKMEIDTGGRFFALEMTSPLDYNLGTVDDNGVATLGNTGSAIGTATFHGTNLEIVVTSDSGMGANFSNVGLMETRKYVLHQVKPSARSAATAVTEAAAQPVFDTEAPAAFNPGDTATRP
jgi:hypothetical protein